MKNFLREQENADFLHRLQRAWSNIGIPATLLCLLLSVGIPFLPDTVTPLKSHAPTGVPPPTEPLVAMAEPPAIPAPTQPLVVTIEPPAMLAPTQPPVVTVDPQLSAAPKAMAHASESSTRVISTNAIVAPVQRLVDGLIGVMKASHDTSPKQRFAMLAPVIDETFDLDEVLQSSVGPTWMTLLPDQQQALMTAFRRYSVASYVSSFDEYKGQRFEVNPIPISVGDERIVRTEIVPVSGEKHELDYVMRQVDSGRWRIVDVLADGSISRVAVQRSDFRRLIDKGGAMALIGSLSHEAAKLGSDTPG